MEAQRFPADFDGIVAGAPVLNFVDTLILGLWHARALEPAPDHARHAEDRRRRRLRQV